jgi:hypothetical protein
MSGKTVETGGERGATHPLSYAKSLRADHGMVAFEHDVGVRGKELDWAARSTWRPDRRAQSSMRRGFTGDRGQVGSEKAKQNQSVVVVVAWLCGNGGGSNRARTPSKTRRM